MSRKTKTTATKEEATPALVPKLRFPEFRGAKEWNNEILEDLLAIPATYGIVTAGEFQQEGIPMLRGGDIKDGCVGDGLPLVSSEIHSQYRRTILQADDVVIALVGYPGEAAVIPSRYVGANISRAVGLLRLKDVQGSRFLACYLNSPMGRQTVLKPSAGSAQVVVNLKHLNALLIPVPSPAEQQKIAECLSSVDELMAAQARKVDALKTHKKGLMQQLFPREGETQPRLRFPEFQNAGEWEMKRVDEQGSVLAGKALAVDAPGPQRPYLRTKNVLDGAIDLSDVLTMPMTDAEFTRFEILDGDVLLNEGQSLELVGRASIYRGEFGQRCAMQNALLRFRAFPSTSAEFAAQYFRQCQKDGTFANVATKTTSVAHLGSSRFSALELAWPTPAEQQRIATCLSSLDALITAETHKHEALKTHKKGLMQQLFPSPEEVEA